MSKSEQLSQFLLPKGVLNIYDELLPLFLKKDKWTNMSEERIWYGLCLCILSSNVPFELACSCITHLVQIRMLDILWILQKPEAEMIIGKELSLPIYYPKKKDGGFRKYRFPSVKARNIVDCAKLIYDKGNGLKLILKKFNSEEKLRNMLAEHFPGLGLKESSHFLRNIGYSRRLAIIDIHIISFLSQFHLLPREIVNMNPRNYYFVEDIMRQISDQHSLDLSVLDNAIWHYMRRST